MNTEDQDRRNKWQNWLERAKALATRSDDNEALRVVMFLENNALLARPSDRCSVVALDSTEQTPWVAVVPVFADDLRMYPEWRGYFERIGGVAAFDPEARAILFRGNTRYSEFWQGLLLLHEGHHAFTYLHNPYDSRNEMIYLGKEQETHTYQNRLVSQLCGPQYETLVQNEVNRLETACKQIHRADRSQRDQVLLTNVEYPPEFIDIFGGCDSESEQGMRWAHWIIHTRFEFLARHFPDNIAEYQSFFLQSMYNYF